MCVNSEEKYMLLLDFPLSCILLKIVFSCGVYNCGFPTKISLANMFHVSIRGKRKMRMDGGSVIEIREDI